MLQLLSYYSILAAVTIEVAGSNASRKPLFRNQTKLIDRESALPFVSPYSCAPKRGNRHLYILFSSQRKDNRHLYLFCAGTHSLANRRCSAAVDRCQEYRSFLGPHAFYWVAWSGTTAFSFRCTLCRAPEAIFKRRAHCSLPSFHTLLPSLPVKQYSAYLKPP